MYQVTLYKDAADQVGTVVQASYLDQVISDGQLGLGINVSDKFTFKIYPFASIYNEINGMVSQYKIESEIDGHELSRGRILLAEEIYDGSTGYYKAVTCSSDLDYLNDSKQPFQKVQNTTPAQDFTSLINIHNQQVSADRQFKVGKMEITNSTDNVYHYVTPGTSTFATINEKLITKWGGELRIRHENDGNYIDWLKEIGIHATQVIDVDTNLKTIERKLDPSQVYSVFYPYGATIEQTNATETNSADVASPRLTISSVNSGHDYLERSDLIGEFGRISGTKNWDDVHDAKILLSKAKTDFANYRPVAVGYQIGAIDLKPFGLAVDSFSVGNYNRLINEYMGIDDELRIATITLNLDNPETDTLTIGDKELTLAEYNSKQRKAVAQIDLMNGVIIGQNAKITELSEAAKTASASLKKLKDDYEDLINTDGSTVITAQLTALQNQTATVIANLGEIGAEVLTNQNAIADLKIMDAKLDQRISALAGSTGGTTNE
ncbi:MAG: phage tail protein [Loigolactobacillus coryniformis]|uniref:phage tail protein n=2 Tax=Loigolactobacillus coryniformis TaxID=1610 RepID=UPI00264784EE|nr:phage tail protein [Loigolactobacillus coryniformis]MDN5951225.1 phage tail protein [Loigolactobacillus coryniformis]MDN5953025.1 phage tail protein [Loigolactobacillus coryniformis]